jgi:hypothetical protein
MLFGCDPGEASNRPMKIKISPLLLLFCAGTLAVVLWAGRALTGGTVTHLAGSGRLNGAPLAVGARLRAGDLVELDAGAVAAARFPFRAAVRLAEGRLGLRGVLKELAFDLHAGSLMSSVRPGGKFRVNTPLAAASVRGTDLFVHASAAETYVCACRGRVAVEAGPDRRELAAEHHSAVAVGRERKIGPDEMRLHGDQDVAFTAALLGTR